MRGKRATRATFISGPRIEQCRDIMGLISRLPAEKLPPTVRNAMDRLSRYEERHGEFSARLLSDLRTAWLAVPCDQRRELQNGWPSVEPPPHSRIEGWQGPGISRFMELAGGVGRDGFGSLQFEFNGDSAPVRLMIVEGTPKEEAIAAAKRMVESLEYQWDQFIASGGEEIVRFQIRQKSEASNPQAAPMLAGDEGKLAMSA